MWFAVTLAVAVCGSLLGWKLKIPAGILLGAILCVALFQIISGQADVPDYIRVISQGIVGTHVGTLFRKEDLLRLKKQAGAVAIMLCGIFLYNLIISVLLDKLTPLDFVTAICAFAPCSIADMSLLCEDLGGNTGMVAAIQTMRLFSVLLIVPVVVTRIRKLERKRTEKKTRIPVRWNWQIAVTLVIGLSASYLGYALKVPAGSLSFSMVAVGIFQLLSGKSGFHPSLRKPAQCLSGMLVGSRITAAHLAVIAPSMGGVLLGLLGYLALNYTLAVLFTKCRWMDFETALFSTAPGGMSDMGLLAAEFGGDLLTVSLFQQLRYVGVVLLFPPLIQMLTQIG